MYYCVCAYSGVEHGCGNWSASRQAYYRVVGLTPSCTAVFALTGAIIGIRLEDEDGEVPE